MHKRLREFYFSTHVTWYESSTQTMCEWNIFFETNFITVTLENALFFPSKLSKNNIKMYQNHVFIATRTTRYSLLKKKTSRMRIEKKCVRRIKRKFWKRLHHNFIDWFLEDDPLKSFLCRWYYKAELLKKYTCMSQLSCHNIMTYPPIWHDSADVRPRMNLLSGPS